MLGRGASLSLAAVLLLAKPTAAEVAFSDLAGALAREHVIPAAETFEATAGRLESVVAEGCDDQASAQAAFHETMDAWMAMQHIGFGPITYLRRDSRLYFWPDKTNALGKQLGRALRDGKPELLDAEALGKGSVALQGLPALERLLFPAKALAGDPTFHCAFAGAIATNIATIARGLLKDWRDGDSPYAVLIERADRDDTLFEDSREVVGLFLRSLDQGLLVVDEFRLGRPLGAAGGRPKPRRAESWRSARSGRNVTLVLAALSELAAPDDGGGFAGLLEAAGEADLAERLRSQMAATREAAAPIGDTLADAVEDPARRSALEALRAKVRETRALVSAEVAPTLGITIGFNSLDGD